MKKKSREKTWFHQDNTRLHTSVLSMTKLNILKFELPEQPLSYIHQIWLPVTATSPETWNNFFVEAIAALEQYFA